MTADSPSAVDSVATAADSRIAGREGIDRRTGKFNAGNTADATGSRSSPTTASVQMKWRDVADPRRRMNPAPTAAAATITELFTTISTMEGVIAYLPAHASASATHSTADTRRRTTARPSY